MMGWEEEEEEEEEEDWIPAYLLWPQVLMKRRGWRRKYGAGAMQDVPGAIPPQWVLCAHPGGFPLSFFFFSFFISF